MAKKRSKKQVRARRRKKALRYLLPVNKWGQSYCESREQYEAAVQRAREIHP